MKKYNRDKRAKYNARMKNINTHDTFNTHDKYKRIHINVHYDRYNHTEYIPIIYKKTRNNKAQTYVNITNAINDIFPEINEPHTKHIYRANAPYRKFIPQEINYTRQKCEEETRTIYRRERVKCIIYNNEHKMIHYGIFIRTISINGKEITYELHRANRHIEVKPFIPFTQTINGVGIKEIWRHNVEIYHI